MDINEPKTASTFNDNIKNLIKILTIKNKIELKGSASLASQKFPADLDFYTTIIPNDIEKVREVVKRINSDPNLYFIELKEQRGNKKKKYYPNTYSDKLSMKNPDFIKIDLVCWFENRFIEASCIYQINQEKQTTEEYISDINKDIEELIKEEKYYKVLKRLFSIYRAKNDKKKQLKLTKIFNSEIGENYQIVSNVEALVLVLEYYKDDLTKKRVALNLKEIGKIENPYKFIKSEFKLINNISKDILDNVFTS